MSKLSRMPTVGPRSVVKTELTPSTRTAGGAPGYARDEKSELFLLAITNFVGEDTFYENAKGRDTRFRDLIRSVSLQDSAWTASFLKWLRSDANMRSASIVGAIEYGRTVSGAGYHKPLLPSARTVLVSVLQRPDEPGEALGYWTALYGRPVPKWLKRALGDAALKLYREDSALKYDGREQPVRFADVLEFSQIEKAHEKNELFLWLLDRRHGRENLEKYPELNMLSARAALESWPVEKRRKLIESGHAADQLKTAGYTWESLSGWLQGPMDAVAWEAIIPSMGYMALLRNLRNFDQAGVSDAVADQVIAKLKDPEQVARSRQLPMRFLSAYNAAPSDRWKHPLSVALDLSLGLIPKLHGETIVLVDTSGSMTDSFSKDGSLKRWDAAAMFGLAFAKANGLKQIYSFSNALMEFPLVQGQNTLSALAQFRQTHFQNGGTQTHLAVAKTVQLHPSAKRILVLTDEQATTSRLYSRYAHANWDDVHAAAGDRMLYTFNLAGYEAGHAPSGEKNRHTFGGLNDSAFKMMALLEARRNGRWPWE